MFEKYFVNFEKLVTLLISEDMKIIGTSSSGRLKENVFYSNISKSKNKGDKISSWGQHKSLHGGYY